MKHYGAETAKAVANFGQGATDAGLIRAYALVKKACIASIQATEQFWEHESYSALIAACDIVASGARNDSFPLSLRQGGAGTSCNMNMNEVLASVAQECFWESHAAERVFHPINDCNRYQSTNDTFTTALTIALLERITALESELDEWHRKMADPSFYKDAPADIQAATARAAEIPPELDRLYVRWSELEAGGGS